MKDVVEHQSASIGHIFSEANNLTPEQLQDIVNYQKLHKVKFGEAAVALGYVKEADVLWALSRQFSYPYLAEKCSRELKVGIDPFCQFSESIRDLRTSVMKALTTGSSKMLPVAFTAANQGAGTSFLVANLALSFGQLQGKTLLIDCNFRRPRQAQIFGIQSTTGFSSVLAGRTKAEVVLPFAEFPSFYVLPVGARPPNPNELLQTYRLREALSSLADKFDYILIDTPAWSGCSDARIVVEAVGSAAMIADKGQTKLATCESVNREISRVVKNYLGVVLNDRTAS